MEPRKTKPPSPRPLSADNPTPEPPDLPDLGGLEASDVAPVQIEPQMVDLGELDLSSELGGELVGEFEDELRLQPLEETPIASEGNGRRAIPAFTAPAKGRTQGARPPMAATVTAIPVTPVAGPRRQAQAEGRPGDSTKNSANDSANQPAEATSRRRWRIGAAPSWLVSLVVHVILILTLAAITLNPVDKVLSILNAATSDAAESIEQFEVPGAELDASEVTSDPLLPPTTQVSEIIEMPELTSTMLTNPLSAVDVLDTNRLTEGIMPSALLSGGALSQMTTALNSRSSASKSEMLERFGGTSESEKAVAMALKWIAEHQASNGGWTFAHSQICRGQCDGGGDMGEATNAATAMAILPFLGAGQTHMEGQYKQTVHRGLSFLINRMKVTGGQLPEGSWHEPGGTMYSHGLASIAICEAYAMTHDADLLQPAQLSLNYLIASQDPRGGGWRYQPRQPGDTSVVGWCVMALKSGRMGNLIVPEQTFLGAQSFLDSVSTNKGAYYGYDQPTAQIEGRQATIAVGLLCRMYMGWSKEHPGMQEGVAYLSKLGPRVNDLYYSYYGTQVMRHYGGPEWEKWNAKLRDELIKSQVSQGHAAGSWEAHGAHSEKGGRLYATSLATMILEVYYRHMPLYSERSSQDDFEL